MKLLHIGDLHIGKRVNEFNMLEDQRRILQQILEIADQEEVDGVLLAGDLYDKALPSAEAVALLDFFLTGLHRLRKSVFLISGNHDSPERLEFGSRIMENHGLYIAGVFNGTLPQITLQDTFGDINFYLMPFIKPAMVRPYFEQPIESFDEAVRAVLAATPVNPKERNVLVAHQFVTSGMQQPQRSDSEALTIGGLDSVDASAFADFDYVALGHLHGPQRIGRDTIRYAGSPLKYSFSEARHNKSVVLVELKEKGVVEIQLIPLTPTHDMREIRGPIAELLQIGKTDETSAEDYIHATLTDEEEIYDAIGQMRQVYPNLMVLDFDNSRSKQNLDSQTAPSGELAKKTPMELFADFYQLQNNLALSEEQTNKTQKIFDQVGGLDA